MVDIVPEITKESIINLAVNDKGKMAGNLMNTGIFLLKLM